MKKSKMNQKNEGLAVIPDLKYYIKVKCKGHLWWKKSIYITGIAVIGDLYTHGENHKVEDKFTLSIQMYIDDKLESLDIFSKNIIPNIYVMSVSSQWSNEELDKAIDHFVNSVIKYK